MTNPHRFDFHPDKYIAGVSAQLTAEEQGVYWMVCALIMSHRGPIKDDPIRIGKLCLVSKRRAERILSSLVSKGKIERVSGEIRQKTAEKSVEKARNIIETYRKNGLNGGRPSNNNKGLPKASGSENNGPPNLNLKPKPNPSKEESNQEHASPDGEANEPMKAKGKTDGQKRGTRIPADWKPDADDRAVAEAEGYRNGQIERLTDCFKDFWISQPGQRGFKLDWKATWRNYVRGDIARRQAGGTVTPGGGQMGQGTVAAARRLIDRHRRGSE